MVSYSREDDRGLVFGDSGLRAKIMNWLGYSYPGVPIHKWPVRVRLDDEGRVDRIERSGEFSW